MRVRHPVALATALLLALTAGLAQAAGEEAAIREQLRLTVPKTRVLTIKPSAMPGLYEVETSSGVLYASADGQFALQGELFSLKGGKLANLTEKGLIVRRANTLAEIKDRDTVVFPAKGKSRGTLTVFTDVSCGYCRRLHQQIDSFAQAGITVRYLAFPRDLPRVGPSAGSAAAMAPIWCAADRGRAITLAMQGGELAEPPGCKSPVIEHYSLGERMGVTGTPAVFTEDGRLIGGYLTAEAAVRKLGAN